MPINSLLEKLKKRQDLNKSDIELLIQSLKCKNLSEDLIKDLVIAWRKKSEAAEELVLLANELFKIEPQIQLSNGKSGMLDVESSRSIVDVCGTGGDKTNTFNISTLAAIVASACGVEVIKHSGRSTTSVTGSVDVLESIGVNIDLMQSKRLEVFEKTNLMFVASTIFKEIFGDVKKVCKSMDVPGFVNLLGPLANPYKTDFQLLGVSHLAWGEILSTALKLQNKKRALIVCSKVSENQYLDELSFCGENHTWLLLDGEIEYKVLIPDSFGESQIDLGKLIVKNTEESKDVFQAVLMGKADSEKSKIVALNAGAALFIANKAQSIQEGYEMAQNCIHKEIAWEHYRNYLKLIT